MAKRSTEDEVGLMLAECRSSKRLKEEEIGETSSNELKPDNATKNEVEFNSFLTELDVGTTEYMGNHLGCYGVIKQRYSDFIVHEIDLQGNLIQLTRTTEPLDEEEKNLPDNFLDEDTKTALQKLNDDGGEPVFIDVTDKSKDDRRAIHGVINKWYKICISSTVDKNGKKFVEVKSSNAKSGNRDVRRRWPPTRGNYTSFVLYKENIDTIEAISVISKILKIKPGAFTYAGTKDRRALTSQEITIYRTEARRLLSLNNRLRNAVIGDVKYVQKPLRLGDLWGNRFNIVLRNVVGTDEDIEKAMDSLKTNGFLNYYGMQRFGTTTVPTYKVGLALLKSDWKTAIDLILQPRPGEDSNMTVCRKMWKENESPKKILSIMKRNNSPEAHLLRGLDRHGTKDLVNALNAIPRNMRMMYVHSYQSYVWNRIVTRKYKTYGVQPIEGDLYMKESDPNNGVEEEVEIQTVERPKPQYFSSNDDISSEDLVLPLFGYDISYPNNEVAKWYEEILSSDGLDINDVKRKIKDYSLPGSYRHVIVKPKSVEWSISNYDDVNIPLLPNDKSQMLNEIPPFSKESSGEFKAMKIQFDLPRSSYATMALREVLRIDTSPNYQKSLNHIS
ncbi:multisubstrate pseudouridine synthase 7 [Chamberlinius hualienensis]